ncbi:phosphatidylglycerophosphatase A [Bordetella genomosp. 9]|uniref:Phosphatidylglycerophosphatase A n=2 Tax=Bordetella genomosp. 9 TaxID=1416803 RepID=A0A1W6Z5C2_9BORD|nr:phosphatidylglycerophosphatase A [Bordetella genomosp. 9]ARP88486.1 phosphatidylglycerophosphatase A [Bordetella genomosp. 9]ARP92439.1 phosphatidylglycerophosphatase A [Bordetella genomosp. 9]
MRDRSRVAYPAFSWICGSANRFIAFGLGSGLLRPASGTWGTLLAWLLWLPAARWLSDPALGLLIALSLAYGCWACHRVGRELGQPDHVGMVWDEMAAFWLVLWLTPNGWLAQACAFVLFRAFDIGKPPPIRYFDARMKNGIGVMWDDLLAAAYTLLVMAIAVRMGAFR